MKTSLLLTATLLTMGSPVLYAQTQKTDTTAVATYDLQEIVISADKPLVQSDGAKLTYNLEEDPAAKGNTLMEALKKVPMVSVDGEDKIRINGQENFKIYINGKEDPSLTSNYKYVFKAMPADAVVKIEVITEPGAKYDAEGTAGILNIITVTKNTTDGFSGSVETYFSRSQAGGSVYGRMKKNKLSMSVDVAYANGSIFPQITGNTQTNINYNSDKTHLQINKMYQVVTFDYLGAGLNLSYDLTDNDLITVNGNIFNMNGKLDKKKSVFSTMIYDSSNTLMAGNKRSINADLGNSGINAGAAWQHNFSGNGHKTILSYLYNHGYNKLIGEMTAFESYGYELGSPYERMSTKGFDNEHTLQFDYVNPFDGEHHTLETGAKGIWRRNLGKSYELTGENQQSAVESLTDRSELIQKQDIYALYASYTAKFDDFSLNAGLRYEHTNMGIDYLWGETPDFMNHLNDLVPNLAVTYMFSPASNLRLAYQMRISRPSLKQVNPFRQNYLHNYVECGNPELESERSNKISLTYSNFGRILGGNVGVEYSSINNAIARTYSLEGETFVESYGNIGHDRYFAVFGFLNWNIIQGMQFSVNARLTHQSFASRDENLSNSGWNVNYGANWNYTLKSGYRFNVYGGQSSRNYTLNGYQSGWHYYGVGISKNFLKDDALTLTVNANNFLKKNNKFYMKNDIEGFSNSLSNTYTNWNVGITLSWRFGSLKSDVKKTDISISNDDKSSIGGKSGGF